MQKLQYEYDPDNLRTGELVGTNERMVMFASLISPGGHDTYPTWLAICTKENEYHKYSVTDVIGTPDGWYACSGEYFHNIKDAMTCYIKRGGN